MKKQIKKTQLEELQEGDYRCYVTKNGFDAEATAKVLKKSVNITHIQIGRGKLPADQSPALVTNLVESHGPEGRFECSVTTDFQNPGGYIVQIAIPSDHAINGTGYEINEAACLLDTGLIYAYRRVPTDFKLVTEGESKSSIIRMRFRPANAELISFTIDPTIVLATHEDIKEEIKKHKEEENPHGQYLLSSQSAKDEDIEGESQDKKFILLPQLWKAIKNKISEAIELITPSSINAQNAGMHTVGVASFYSPATVDIILIVSSDEYTGVTMPVIEITGRGLFSTAYTVASKIIIGTYYYQGGVYNPTALVTGSGDSPGSVAIYLVNYKGLRAYALRGGYHSLLNVSLHSTGDAGNLSRKEGWTTQSMTDTELRALNPILIDSAISYTSKYNPRAKDIEIETKEKRTSTVQEQFDLIHKENMELRLSIKKLMSLTKGKVKK